MSASAPQTPTPGPWRKNNLLVVDQHGETVAHCTRWENLSPRPLIAEANSAHIVRCVNAHDDLLNAAHAAFHALKSYEHGNASPDLARNCARALEDAIAKAEGRS